MTRGNRLFSALIAAIALAALAAQFTFVQGRTGDLGASFRWLSGYFTILTNGIVAIAFAAQVFGRRLSAREAAAITTSIIMIGLVYHLILARSLPPYLLRWWADLGLHALVPTLVPLWWMRFAPRGLSLRDLPFCLAWPLLYCLAVLIRGAATGFFPYPFLDAHRIGWEMVALNVVELALAFAALTLLLIGLARITR
ncbi:MAG: Pr6Pr family membrane protein [Pseudorhodobacter sp.]